MEEEEAGGGETKQDTNKVAKDDIELFRPVAFKCVTLQEKGQQNLHCYRDATQIFESTLQILIHDYNPG